jgi:hypothetical protein
MTTLRSRRTSISSVLTAVVVVLGVAAGGCAGEPARPGASPSPTAGSKVPGTSSSTPGLSVVGVVEKLGIEGGCLVLRADSGRTYELLDGDPSVVKPGARVSVTGTVRTDLASICQVGPILDVASARPA